MPAVVLPLFRSAERAQYELRRAIADGDPDVDSMEDDLPLGDRIAAALERYQAETNKV